jgi:hypothetical protein
MGTAEGEGFGGFIASLYPQGYSAQWPWLHWMATLLTFEMLHARKTADARPGSSCGPTGHCSVMEFIMSKLNRSTW